MSTICLGTYSGGLIGATVDDNDEAVKVELSFAMGVHSGPVKCLATAGPCLISGGADESSNVFDLEKNCEIGTLEGHETDVLSVDMIAQGTALHALTGGADGRIAVFKRGGREWTCLGAMKGHTGPVTGIAIHPSGKAALSVAAGDENKLRLWDLVRGSCAVSQQLHAAPLGVRWDQGGRVYAVWFATSILLRHGLLGNAFKHFSPGSAETDDIGNLSSLCFINDCTLVVGTTKGELIVVTFVVAADDGGDAAESGHLRVTAAERFEVFDQRQRVKAVAMVAGLVAAVTSEGRVQLLTYSLDAEGLPLLRKEIEWESNARVTCMVGA